MALNVCGVGGLPPTLSVSHKIPRPGIFLNHCKQGGYYILSQHLQKFKGNLYVKLEKTVLYVKLLLRGISSRDGVETKKVTGKKLFLRAKSTRTTAPPAPGQLPRYWPALEAPRPSVLRSLAHSGVSNR